MSEYIVRIPSDMPYEIKAELYAWYVNSEPIVRCRDCKHYRDISTKHARSGGIGTCDLGLEWTDLYSIVEPLGFCAWGERQGK